VRDIQLHRRHAARYLKKIPKKRQVQIVAALEEVASLKDIRTHPAIKELSGDVEGVYRLRVGSYRVLLRLIKENQIEVIFVDRIGPRGDVYKK
jgi:mRNA-degrading endonuclease RelE of RelBE toxin-antitoxin system